MDRPGTCRQAAVPRRSCEIAVAVASHNRQPPLLQLRVQPARSYLERAPFYNALENLVGASGFEPPTSWSRTLGKARFARFLQVFANYPFRSDRRHSWRGWSSRSEIRIDTTLRSVHSQQDRTESAPRDNSSYEAQIRDSSTHEERAIEQRDLMAKQGGRNAPSRKFGLGKPKHGRNGLASERQNPPRGLPPGPNPNSDPKGTAESSGGIVRFGPVVIHENSVVAAIAK